MQTPFGSGLVLSPYAALLLLAASATQLAAGDRPADYANPLVGTAPLDDQQLIGNAPPPGEEIYTGFTSPGVALPHGNVNASPVNKDLEVAAGNHGIIYPYTYPRRTMMGFSSMVPGMMLMPIVGNWTVPPDRSYASVYSKASERASPGYYTVYFPDHRVQAELTTTRRTALYRFTFPKTDQAAALLDLGPGEASIEVFGDHIIRGRTAGGGRRGRSPRFFVAEFSKPFSAFGTFKQNVPSVDRGRVRRDDRVTPNARAESGSYAGCYVNFSTAEHEAVMVKVASGASFEAAQSLLSAEDPNWDFDAVKQQAEDAWNEKLGAIEVKGGTKKERTLFYSTLYHSLDSPQLIAKKGEPFRGFDGQTRTGDYDRYSVVPFWDTGRGQIVLLLSLIHISEPTRQAEISYAVF